MNPVVVVDVATAIALERGLDGVSIRAVASRLGVAPTTIYGHIGSLEELRDLVVARLFQLDDDSEVWPDEWQELVRRFARHLREVLQRHPAILNAMIRSPQLPSRTMRPLELLLRELMRAGMTLEDASLYFTTLFDYVAGHVQAQFAKSAIPPDAGNGVGRYPDLPALSEALSGTETFRDSFEAGLDFLVLGAEAHLQGSAAKSARHGS